MRKFVATEADECLAHHEGKRMNATRHTAAFSVFLVSCMLALPAAGGEPATPRTRVLTLDASASQEVPLDIATLTLAT
jgi:hypothetical protein